MPAILWTAELAALLQILLDKPPNKLGLSAVGWKNLLPQAQILDAADAAQIATSPHSQSAAPLPRREPGEECQ